MNVRTSINIKYDIHNGDILNNYYATTTHTRVMNSILGSILDENQDTLKSHIIYGPYGTGKSFFGTILSKILSGEFKTSKSQKELIGKFASVDDITVSLLDGFFKSNKKYIPIIINGNEGKFEDVILDRIKEEVRERKLRIRIPGIETQITQQISLWRRKYPDTYERLIEILKKDNLTITGFTNGIRDSNIVYIEKFLEIFPELTSGQKFTYKSNLNFILTIEEICFQLGKHGFGLFIVYDEFGRYLTSLSEHNINSFMQQLQDLAELSNNLTNLSQLYILHKPASTYFTAYGTEYRLEFSKIEKRFATFDIKNDYKTFTTVAVNIIEEAIEYNAPEGKVDKQIEYVNYYRELFEEAFDFTFIEKTIKSIYPIHPITLLLLPKISNIFGQNERTLFTFLNDKSRDGIYNYYKQDKGFYYVDYLADYFLKQNDNLLLNELTVYKLYLKQVAELKKLFPDDYEGISRVYKLLMIWNITNQNLILSLDSHIISYALDIQLKEAEKYIKMLRDIKFIKYNPIKQEYEIFEGSSLDIEQAINKTLAKEKYTNQDIFAILNDNNPYRVIYPVNYNAGKETTRFAIIQFTDETLDYVNSDMMIYIFINEEKKDIQCDGLVGNIVYDMDRLKKVLLRIYAIEKMLSDNYLLRTYKNLDVELNLEKEFAIKDLNDFYERIFSPVTNFYHYNGKDVNLQFKSLDELELFLSSKFPLIFTNSIEIVNNQINMFEITRIQENAIINVIDKLLKEKKREVNFDGSQPQDLVYHSISNGALDNVAKHIKNKLIIHGVINFSDIFEELIKPSYGYGLRPKTALLVVIFSVADLLSESMIFNGDTFVPNIDGRTLFEKTLEEDNKYKIVYSHYEHTNRKYLDFLENLFPYSSSNTEHKSKLVSVCSGMYNWLLDLPLVTQQKVDMGMAEADIISIISKTRSNPQEAVQMLIDKYDMDVLKVYKQNIDNHFDIFVNKLERNIKQIVENSYNNLDDIAKGLHKNNKAIMVLINNKSFVEEYSTLVDGTPINIWPVPMFEVLKKRVEEDLMQLSDQYEYQVLDVDGRKKIIRDTKLSVKGKVIEENLCNTINATKNTISPNELEQIILNLVSKYIK